MEKFRDRIKEINESTNYAVSLKMEDADHLHEMILKRISTAPPLSNLYGNEEGSKVKRSSKFLHSIEQATIYFDETATDMQQGIYVFIFENKVVYFGITRNLHTRLRTHCFSKTKNSSNLAKMLSKKVGDQPTEECDLDKEIEAASKFIRENFRFLFIPIENYTKKYWLEVTLANKFQAALNSFKTH